VLALVRRESVHITFAICIDALGIRSHCFRQRDVWRYQCSRRRRIARSLSREPGYLSCTDTCNVSQESRSRDTCCVYSPRPARRRPLPHTTYGINSGAAILPLLLLRTAAVRSAGSIDEVVNLYKIFIRFSFWIYVNIVMRWKTD